MNSTKLKLGKKYKPLFQLAEAQTKIKEKGCPKIYKELATVENVIITGGRDSAKTFHSSLATSIFAANYNHRILYTRYTLTSAKKSIIPAFQKRIDLINYNKWFNVTVDSITCPHNNGKIDFAGIKTSSGNQTANLKSLEDYSVFICDEAEEYQSYDEWDKIQLSIRATDVQAFNVLILNPTTKKHWIYEEFFRNKGVEEGFNGIKDGVLYIHTTYLDVDPKHIAPKNFRKYEAARIIYERLDGLSKEEFNKQPKRDIKQYKYYKHVVLGGWLETAEGLVFDDWTMYTEDPEEYGLKIYGLDFGFSNDPAAFVQVIVKDKDLFIRQFIYKTGLLNDQLFELIDGVIDKRKSYVVADSASPKDIAELKRLGLAIMPCTKGPDSIMHGIKRMKKYNIHIHKDSTDLQDEFNNYRAIEMTNTKGETKTHVVDSDNHGIDAARYALTRYAT